MRMPMSLWLLLLLPAGLAHGQPPAQSPFRYDYSELFADPIQSPLLADAKYFESGALALEKADFVTAPAALRVDCSKLQGRGLGVIFLLLGDQLKAVRGKQVTFRCQIKPLSGAGGVTLRLRCYGKDWRFVYASHAVSFSGTPGQWQALTLRTAVPSSPEVDTADFVLDVENTTESLRLLLDDCVLSVDTEAGKTAPSAFAAAVPESARPLPLVSAGKPAATIVTPEQPSPALAYAVQELSDHLRLSTGAGLPVVEDGQAVNGPTIQIGATARSRQLGLAPEFLAPDSWVVRRVGDALILSGGAQHGVPARGREAHPRAGAVPQPRAEDPGGLPALRDQQPAVQRNGGEIRPLRHVPGGEPMKLILMAQPRQGRSPLATSGSWWFRGR